MRWDLFCRVVDNFGDIGVCWRLARDLASRGETVRLYADDLSPLAWMAGADAALVGVDHWSAAESAVDAADVVVEAFGCNPPPRYLQAMAERRPAPRWVNLEYLSAEPYVERSHGLPSPQLQGPAAGLTKSFFFPGFTAATGGLLREPRLLAQRAAFDRDDWLAAHGWPRRGDEQVVLLFAYRNAALPALLERLAATPTLLLLAGGPSQQQTLELLAARPAGGRLRAMALPFVAQPEFDRLLWSADCNFVRGEDSLVRAIWAGRPFVWQLYPQTDGAHRAKLEAFLGRLLDGCSADLAQPLRAVFGWWNGGPHGARDWPDAARWTLAVQNWRERLVRQDDLTTQLLRHVGARS